MQVQQPYCFISDVFSAVSRKWFIKWFYGCFSDVDVTEKEDRIRFSKSQLTHEKGKRDVVFISLTPLSMLRYSSVGMSVYYLQILLGK